MKVYRLRDMFRKGNWKEHFYDGSLKVVDGVIEIPENKAKWLGQAWIRGFRIDPETGRHINSVQTVRPTPVPAKSAEVKDGDNKETETPEGPGSADQGAPADSPSPDVLHEAEDQGSAA